MSKPTILTVDDDPHGLGGDHPRPAPAGTAPTTASSGRRRGAQALAVLTRLALRDEPVALIAADQRMPQMTGIEMLEQARTHAPGAKFLLLTAYADTDVAIKAINDIGLDYYLLKPWDPPEERLYPVIDDLLGDWRQANPDAHRPTSGWSGTDGPTAATSIKTVPGPQPRPLPLVRHRARRRGPAAARPRRGGAGRPAARARARRRHAPLAVDARPRRRARAAHHAPSSRCTTCASSAAGRPAWPPRCTRRPRA